MVTYIDIRSKSGKYALLMRIDTAPFLINTYLALQQNLYLLAYVLPSTVAAVFSQSICTVLHNACHQCQHS